MQLPKKTRRTNAIKCKCPQPQNSEFRFSSHYPAFKLVSTTHHALLFQCEVRVPCSQPLHTQQGFELTSIGQQTAPADPAKGTHLPEERGKSVNLEAFCNSRTHKFYNLWSKMSKMKINILCLLTPKNDTKSTVLGHKNAFKVLIPHKFPQIISTVANKGHPIL